MNLRELVEVDVAKKAVEIGLERARREGDLRQELTHVLGVELPDETEFEYLGQGTVPAVTIDGIQLMLVPHNPPYLSAFAPGNHTGTTVKRPADLQRVLLAPEEVTA